MRAFLILLVACGGATSTPSRRVTPTGEPAARKSHAQAKVSRPRVDPIAGLTATRVETAWLEPGPAQLVLGGTTLQATDDTPLAVDFLEERGSEIRVGVRLDHVRFAVWTSRTRLLAVLSRSVNVSTGPSSEFVAREAPSVQLLAGAHVHRLAHKPGFTQIRYAGSLEVEGWVPDDALDDVGPADHRAGGRPPTFKPLMVSVGATIRTEKRWAARSLAVARYSMFLETVEVLDEGWHRVAYRDGDVVVHGFLSKREPPSRITRRREQDPPVTITTNVTVPADTCLYGGDEPIGFVIGDRAALVEPSPRVGWFTITLDTPWGPVAFDASGPTESSLAKCPTP